MNDVAGSVKDFLRRISTLSIRCPVDNARRDLAAATNLQWSIPNIDVGGREPQHLPLMLVLNLEMSDLLYDIRIQRNALRPHHTGSNAHGYCQES
jgi:hypothetical protein